MTEVEKMRSSQLADMAAPELQVRFEHAKKLLAPIVIYPPSRKVQLAFTNTCSPNLIPSP